MGLQSHFVRDTKAGTLTIEIYDFAFETHFFVEINCAHSLNYENACEQYRDSETPLYRSS